MICCGLSGLSGWRVDSGVKPGSSRGEASRRIRPRKSAGRTGLKLVAAAPIAWTCNPFCPGSGYGICALLLVACVVAWYEHLGRARRPQDEPDWESPLPKAMKVDVEI